MTDYGLLKYQIVISCMNGNTPANHLLSVGVQRSPHVALTVFENEQRISLFN